MITFKPVNSWGEPPWTNASPGGGTFDEPSAPWVHTNFLENEAKGTLVHANFPSNSYGPEAQKSL